MIQTQSPSSFLADPILFGTRKLNLQIALKYSLVAVRCPLAQL